jgi:hypothetical protein
LLLLSTPASHNACTASKAQTPMLLLLLLLLPLPLLELQDALLNPPGYCC